MTLQPICASQRDHCRRCDAPPTCCPGKNIAPREATCHRKPQGYGRVKVSSGDDQARRPLLAPRAPTPMPQPLNRCHYRRIYPSPTEQPAQTRCRTSQQTQRYGAASCYFSRVEVLSNLERSDATRSLFLPNSAKGFYRLPLWVVELPILKNSRNTQSSGKLTHTAQGNYCIVILRIEIAQWFRCLVTDINPNFRHDLNGGGVYLTRLQSNW